MLKTDKILVTGAHGMVGSSLVTKLQKEGYENILTPSSKELNLTLQDQTNNYFFDNTPDYVFHLAAKVGGIQANINNPALFLRDNLLINCNVFDACSSVKVKKVLYLGSSCIYPTKCEQPMKEEYLLSGKLEPTNEGYALSKIIGLKLAEVYYKQFGLKSVCLMPCNIYGTGDCFDLDNSHVLSALVKKFVDAAQTKKKGVSLWGDGSARREFIHVNDVVDSILYLFDKIDEPKIINIGPGDDLTIKELAKIIAKSANFKGKTFGDKTKPSGMKKKLLCVSKMKELGFSPKIGLENGIRQTINEYKGSLK